MAVQSYIDPGVAAAAEAAKVEVNYYVDIGVDGDSVRGGLNGNNGGEDGNNGGDYCSVP
jgi:hypothetical protein